MATERLNWNAVQGTPARVFTCSYCDNVVSSVLGWQGSYQHIANATVSVQLCPNCLRPTFFDVDRQVPDVAPGREVAGLPTDVELLYREARNCVAASAYTGAILCARKLLMNIAVAQGDHAGRTFFEYIDYLASKGFVPPNGRGWIDHIRRKGNEATHEIQMMARADAEELITFIEMLLKFIYEFPSKVPPTKP